MIVVFVHVPKTYSVSKSKANKLFRLIKKYLILLSTCLTQLCSPNSIVTTGDLNPSLDIRLIIARRFAPSPLATALHSCWWSKKVKSNQQMLSFCTLSTKKKKREFEKVWQQYQFSSIVAGKNNCLPAGLGLHASGSCEGGPPSAPLSILHHEFPIGPGGLSLVYYHVFVLSPSLTAEETEVKTEHTTGGTLKKRKTTFQAAHIVFKWNSALITWLQTSSQAVSEATIVLRDCRSSCEREDGKMGRRTVSSESFNKHKVRSRTPLDCRHVL